MKGRKRDFLFNFVGWTIIDFLITTTCFVMVVLGVLLFHEQPTGAIFAWITFIPTGLYFAKGSLDYFRKWRKLEHDPCEYDDVIEM